MVGGPGRAYPRRIEFSLRGSAMQTVFTTASRTPPVIALARPMARAPQAAPIGLRRTFAKGDTLFAEGDPSDHFYRLVSGTVRTSKLLSDGRRQIDSFHLAG